MCERNSQLSSPNIPGFGTLVDLAKYTNSEKKMYLFIEMYRKPSKATEFNRTQRL